MTKPYARITRIHRNGLDNWYGYLGSRRVINFGADERDARRWLKAMSELNCGQCYQQHHKIIYGCTVHAAQVMPTNKIQ